MQNTTPAVGGVQTVRRVITYILLIMMVSIAASGLSDLMYRLFTANSVVVSYDNFGLATSLASALIAGPLAALLWWLTWRDAASARDRASVAWPVYLVIMSTVTLLISTIALFIWAAEAISGNSDTYGLALGLVWGLVWLWHYWMWRHPRKGPTRLPGAAPAIASLLGLTYAAGGLVWALARLVDAIVDAIAGTVVVGGPVWQLVLQSLVWVVGGGLVWWWHWFRVGVRTQPTGFANVLLVYIAGFASFVTVAYGYTIAISVVLEILTGVRHSLAITLDPLGFALASALIGALVLLYHARVVAARSAGVRSANRLVSAGVSLAFAATGIGVTVNALLATSSNSLIAGDIRNLLLGGLSALLVGGLLWWVTWRPLGASTLERAVTPGRRVYLVVIFGISALVALITLLVIGFQVFSFMLDGGDGESFVERSRQALGLLVATVLVAAYHFAIWRKDRAADVVEEHGRRIERVTLVASGDCGEAVEAVRVATGARVAVLRRADAVGSDQEAAPLETTPASSIVEALEGVEGYHVLVVAGVNKSIEVIQLAD